MSVRCGLRQLCCWLLVVVGNYVAAAANESLIVFVQTDGSEVDRAFQRQTLPRIQQLAAEMALTLQVREAGDGVPAEVAITPLIVFQNHLGRSIYHGRTTAVGRLRNFIRTSRFVPRSDTPFQRRSVPAWRHGPMTIAAPLKIAAVSGTPPKGYDQQRFVAEALEEINRSFRLFSVQDEVRLRATDRAFYMDFYPWCAADGTLYLSAALFSEFHCKKPVFQTPRDQPFVGSWRRRHKLFRQAAAALEAAVLRSIQDPTEGDGFDLVPGSAPVMTWQALGLPLPPPPTGERSVAPLDATLPLVWVIDPAATGPAPVQFRFAPPLEHYAGAATTVTGTLQLGPGGKLGSMHGAFAVAAGSVTMGEAELDEALQSNVMLHSSQHSAVTFSFDQATGAQDEVAFGQLTFATLSGQFQLKTATVPLAAEIELEPTVNDAGDPRLQLRGTFELDLRPFPIEQAEGPAPARHTMLFNLSFVLRPAASG